MRRIDVAERRARLGIRHHLAAPASTPVAAARGVVALHATDPASVFLSLQARTASVDVAAIERTLYDERSLLRMMGMRRTMFVVPVELAPVVQAGSTNAIAVVQRKRYGQIVERGGLGDAGWLRDVEESTYRALLARGEATGAQLSTDEPRLRSRIVLNEGKAYESQGGITTWVLFLLGVDGRIVRARPRGTWISSQYQWSPTEAWLPGGMPEMPAEEARAELVRRWLAAFGPGTAADLKWWTGWSMGQVKQALAVVQPVEVDMNGGTGLVLPDDVEPASTPVPWVSLLPALDPTPMGWQERSWYLGPHSPSLFDRSGNIGPTVWCDGRVVGGWAQRKNGEVAFRLLEDIGAEASAALDSAAGRLTEWIGPVRVTPRFRTPLERQLTS